MNAAELTMTLPEPGGKRDIRLRCDSSSLGKPLACCNTKEIGRHGENIAASYLEECGLEILERNWRCSFGEVDIIANHDGTLVLVEVKTRNVFRDDGEVAPESSVNYRKLCKYEKLALIYLSKQCQFDSIRFDVIAIRLLDEQNLVLRHLVAAYEWDN